MTIREKLTGLLVDHGIFASDAPQIIKKYEDSDLGQDMKNRFDESTDNYPDTLFTVVWIAVKHTVLEWIEENCPMHWAKVMFQN
jgi:hypothetical protein